jgi:DNA mismatch repair protein MSH5
MFDKSTLTLYVLGHTDAWIGDAACIFETVLELLKPFDIVLMSSKSDEMILDRVSEVLLNNQQINNNQLLHEESTTEHTTNMDDDLNPSSSSNHHLHIKPASMFDYTNAVRNIEYHTQRFHGDNTLGSLVDLSNRASICACGATIKYASSSSEQKKTVRKKKHDEHEPTNEDHISTTELDHDDDDMNDFHIKQVEMFDLGSFMVMDEASCLALDVTKVMEHPSIIRGRGRSKEGFSLLSLLNRTRSVMGGSTIRRWLARPLTDLVEIQHRHDAVQFLSDPLQTEFCIHIGKRLRGVKNVMRSFLRIKTCTSNYHDWLILAESIVNIELILREIQQLVDNCGVEIIPQLLHCTLQTLTRRLVEVGELLDNIDWDSTKNQNSVIPIRGLDQDLDHAREIWNSMDELLTNETQMLTKEFLLYCSQGTSTNHFNQITMRFIPTIGFVVALNSNGSNTTITTWPELPSIMQDIYEPQFQAQIYDEQHPGQVSYYKNNRAKWLDSQYGDVKSIIMDLEANVVRHLENKLIQYETDVLLAAHQVAELDVILSFADVARDFQYTRPVMTRDPILELQAARHPLLERILDSFVPNDIMLGSEILIITGPNFSGKSVVLKTVALLCIMAQIGSFVPATKAKIGIVDRLFTRIQSRESLVAVATQMESSFTIDVQQVVTMLRSCAPNSLLIIDEFGKGTCSFDGAALLAATLEHLAMGRCGPCPRTLTSTHLIEIFEQGLLLSLAKNDNNNNTSNMLLRVAEMQMEFDQHNPVPLFRLKLGGLSRNSFAAACARRVGMAERIALRAEELLLECNNNNKRSTTTTVGTKSSSWAVDGDGMKKRLVKEILDSLLLTNNIVGSTSNGSGEENYWNNDEFIRMILKNIRRIQEF